LLKSEKYYESTEGFDVMAAKLQKGRVKGLIFKMKTKEREESDYFS